MKLKPLKFDIRALDMVRNTMRFIVVLNDSQVESMFPRLDDAINHALEIVPYKDEPVRVYSIRNGDCVLTVWPRDVESGGDEHDK